MKTKYQTKPKQPRLTPREALTMIGQEVLVPLIPIRTQPTAWALCRVIDCDLTWGSNVRLIVEPVGGEGQLKINPERIKRAY
jgi:hypothetical protein